MPKYLRITCGLLLLGILVIGVFFVQQRRHRIPYNIDVQLMLMRVADSYKRSLDQKNYDRAIELKDCLYLLAVERDLISMCQAGKTLEVQNLMAASTNQPTPRFLEHYNEVLASELSEEQYSHLRALRRDYKLEKYFE